VRNPGRAKYYHREIGCSLQTHRIGSQELGDDLRILIEAGWTKSDIRFMELLGMLPKSAIPLILEAHKGGETHRAALGARA
jgi:hypothetical protein